MSLINNTKISLRLWGIVVLSLVGIVAMVIFTLMSLRSELISGEMKKLDAINDVAMGFITDAYEQYEKGQLTETEAIASAIDKVESINYEGREYVFIYDREGMLVMDPSLPKEDRFKANFYGFQDPEGTPLFQHMIERTENSQRATVNYVWELPDSTEVDPKMSRVLRFDEWGWIVGTGVYMNHVADQVWGFFWRVSFIVLLFSLPVLAFFLFVISSVVSPLKSTISAMENIADGDGDLTRRLEVRGKDELAQLAHAFNTFADQVRDLVDQVRGSSASMGESILSLNDTMRKTSEGVNRQQEQTEQVATAMNEMTATAQEVASSASEASSSASHAETQVRHSKEVLNKAISVIGSLSEQVSDGVVVIEELSKDSENIGGVLDVIRGIAEQTNLLALNAAIEAARAADAGRGFAVVADEVRTLASRTQKSTEEIQSMIESFQQRALKAVSVINAISDRSEATVGEARLVDEALISIEDAVNTISNMNAQIATAAEEQTSVAETINRNISHIAEISESTGRGTHHASDETQKLTGLASQLDYLVKDYKSQ